MNRAMQTTVNDDTISLVDLFAVLIRHRRFIGTMIVVVVLFTIVVLYVAPAFGFDGGYRLQFRSTARVQVHSLPQLTYPYIASIPEPIAVAGANNMVRPMPTRIWLSPQFATAASDLSIVSAAWQSFTENRADSEASDVNSSDPVEVSREVASRLSVEIDELTGIVTLVYSADQSEDAVGFIDILVEAAIDAATAQIGASLAEIERAIGTSIERSTELIEQIILQSPAIAEDTSAFVLYSQSVVAPAVSDVVELQNLRATIDSFARNPQLLYSRIGTTALSQQVLWRGQANAPARSTVLVLAIFGAFFAAIFCAFVLEYIRRVKQQPTEMEKLRAAWRRS